MENQGKLLIGGLFAVLIAFSLAFLFQNLWIGYTAAFMTAVIWLIIVDQRVASKNESRAALFSFRVIILLLIVTQALASIQFYINSDRQKETLRTIRTTIIHGISQTEMEKTLLHTLRHYYQESEPSNATLEESFRTLFTERLNEDGTISPEDPDEEREMPLLYEVADPDSIVLSVSAVFTPGYDSNFENSNGNRGMYEAIATLTKEGVVYERQN